MLYTLLCILVVIIIFRLLGIGIFSIVALGIIGAIILGGIALTALCILYFSGQIIGLGIFVFLVYLLLYFGERKDKNFIKKYITGEIKNKP